MTRNTATGANQKLLVPETYPKPKRLPIGQCLGGKKGTYATPEEVARLFRAKVIVEEKMDGETRKMETSDSRFIVFAEDLKVRHSIKYRVPARFVVFDVFDTRKLRFLCRDGKEDFFLSLERRSVSFAEFNAYNFFLVPALFKGKMKIWYAPNLIGVSAYAIGDDGSPSLMEGIVVKPDRELFLAEHVSGKLVRKEFTEGIQEHYSTRAIEYNIINPSIRPTMRDAGKGLVH